MIGAFSVMNRTTTGTVHVIMGMKGEGGGGASSFVFELNIVIYFYEAPKNFEAISFLFVFLCFFST